MGSPILTLYADEFVTVLTALSVALFAHGLKGLWGNP